MVAMLSKLVFLVLSSSLSLATPVTLHKRASPQGIDVSHFQGTINWNTVASNGVAFTYIKATEGTSESAFRAPH